MEATLDRSKSARQLAKFWGISPSKVRQLVRRGIITAIDLGGKRSQLRFTPSAIAEAERRLAVPVAKPRRQRREHVDPEIAALLPD